MFRTILIQRLFVFGESSAPVWVSLTPLGAGGRKIQVWPLRLPTGLACGLTAWAGFDQMGLHWKTIDEREGAAQMRWSSPGGGQGPLSERFAEVELSVKSSFAHDRGMMSSVEWVKVAGEACRSGEVLEKLVAVRGGWGPGGERGHAEVLETFKAFLEDWSQWFQYSTMLKGAEPPRNLASILNSRGMEYHAPKVGLYELSNGQCVVAHAYFVSWDAGPRGTLYARRVDAYRVEDGTRFEIPEDDDGMPSALMRPNNANDTDGGDELPADLPRPVSFHRGY